MRAALSSIAFCGSILAATLLAELPANAQSESGGLRAAIGDVTKKDQRNLTIQIILTNTSRFKQFVMFNSWRAEGSLSSGDLMRPDQNGGITRCENSTKEDCVKNQPDPSYLEPGASISFVTVYYDSMNNLPPTGKISFPLKFVVQTATTTDDVVSGGSPKPPGPPHMVYLNYTQIPYPSP